MEKNMETSVIPQSKRAFLTTVEPETLLKLFGSSEA